MPELPEVEGYRRYIENTSMHRVIDDVEVKNERILHGIKPENLIDMLITSFFIKTIRYGKYLLILLDRKIWLTMHFGMTGSVRFFHNLYEEPAHSRMLIKFEGQNYLSYVDQRLFGKIGLNSSVELFIKEHKLGKDALEIKEDEFKNLILGKNVSIKTTLMKQELIAGIGNEYSDEILFQAKINPTVHAASLSNQQLSVLFEKLNHVLRIAIDVRVNKNSFPDNFLIKSGRKSRICPRCGNKLECKKISGRTGCFCPKCQLI